MARRPEDVRADLDRTIAEGDRPDPSGEPIGRFDTVMAPPDAVTVAESTRQSVSGVFDMLAAAVEQGAGGLMSPEQFAAQFPTIDLDGDGGDGTPGVGEVGSDASIETAARAALAAGFSPEDAATAVAIAAGESGFNPQAHNPDSSTGDNSYGLWQINMLGKMGDERRRQFGLDSNDALFDPVTNAKAAFAISGGGKNWQPWTIFRKGVHQQHLDEARAAVQRVLGEGDTAGEKVIL